MHSKHANLQKILKRWLVVLLVLLALLILLSPAIVGRLAENNIEENIEWAESDSPGVSIQTESFDRGWLTSEGRHRIVLDGGQFREMAEEYTASTGNADLPSLIIDTQLEHGPLPVSTMSPGLANAKSTLQISRAWTIKPLPSIPRSKPLPLSPTHLIHQKPPTLHADRRPIQAIRH